MKDKVAMVIGNENALVKASHFGGHGLQKALSVEAMDMPHNRYHRAARSSAAMAIVYAAMSGRELIEARKQIKHGGWEKWVERNCEFEASTAWRYMGVAEQLKDKMSNLARVQDLTADERNLPAEALIKLLQRPPSELLPAETELLLTDIRAATQGQTLRQLYFDFGLATRPKPAGGANQLHAWLRAEYPENPEYLEMRFEKLPSLVKEEWKAFLAAKAAEGLPPGMSMERWHANTWWTHLLDEIHSDIARDRKFAHLDLDELRNISVALLDARRAIEELIKKG